MIWCDLHFIQPLCGGGGGAVGGDIGPPLRIAHRDRKSAEIGANDANHTLRSAGQTQRFAFARIGCVHAIFTNS